jgi:hypothetical protein
MQHTLQFAWVGRLSKNKLITLVLPPGQNAKPILEIHPLILPLEDLPDFTEACQSAQRVAAAHLTERELNKN